MLFSDLSMSEAYRKHHRTGGPSRNILERFSPNSPASEEAGRWVTTWTKGLVGTEMEGEGKERLNSCQGGEF